MGAGGGFGRRGHMGAWSHLGRGHALGATLDSRVTVQRLDSTLGLNHSYLTIPCSLSIFSFLLQFLFFTAFASTKMHHKALIALLLLQ